MTDEDVVAELHAWIDSQMNEAERKRDRSDEPEARAEYEGMAGAFLEVLNEMDRRGLVA